MTIADPDWQQGGVRRLGFAAPVAAIRVGVWMGGVEKLDEYDVESGALCLSLQQIAHALDDNRPVVELTTPEVFGFGKILIGRAEDTEAHVAEALRLSPRDTMAYMWVAYVGLAKLHLGGWEQAVAWYRRAIEANRNFPIGYFQLAAALMQLGRLDEARSAAKAGLALNPTFTISRARAARTAWSDDPTYLAQIERVLEGMRQAGVPEQ
jgi:tetratricopeptide (TPR) repeat protein